MAGCVKCHPKQLTHSSERVHLCGGSVSVTAQISFGVRVDPLPMAAGLRLSAVPLSRLMWTGSPHCVSGLLLGDVALGSLEDRQGLTHERT